ncbi:MAG: hypothetical protein IBX56_03405 [Methylomicrobium sp.]|nr:hypothetical protein [Methylomicrobium sp.]
MSFHVPNKYRINTGKLATTALDGNNGAFAVKSLKIRHELFCIASDGMGWEHVSVSTKTRCPNWEEMNCIKNLFWDKEDTVIQFHPPESDYVNTHPYCLHLWRPINQQIPRPEWYLVGLKNLTG